MGDRVGMLLPNSIDFAVAYFGALRAGLVAVPFNTAYTASELSYQVADAATSVVVTDADLVAEVLSDLQAEQVLLVGDRRVMGAAARER